MPGVNIQFHMLFGEMTDFVAEVLSQYSLTAELEKFYPAALHTVAPVANLVTETRNFGEVNRIWLLCKPPRSRKPERFALHVGRMKDTRLEQSQFGSRTEKAEAYKALKGIAQELKRRTTAGIWVVTAAGNVGFNKYFRFSPGVAKAQRQRKLQLTAVGFTQSFYVDRPSS